MLWKWSNMSYLEERIIHNHNNLELRILMIFWGRIYCFGSFILILKSRWGILRVLRLLMRGVSSTSHLRRSCCSTWPIFCGRMPTSNRSSECSNSQLTPSNGLVYTKYGFLTSTSLLTDMVMILSEFKEQDQCSKDF